MIRVFVAFCFALLFFTQEGSAQTSFDPAAQEVGAVTTWAHKFGSRKMIYLGTDGDLFRYEWRNKISGPEQIFTIWRDRNAQKTRLEVPGGVVQTYEPHDCRLTVGRCEYTYSHVHKTLPNRQEKWIVINSLKGDVWSYKKYIHSEGSENLRSEGTFTVDEFGMTIDSKGKRYRKGSSKPRPGSIKRIPSAKR